MSNKNIYSINYTDKLLCVTFNGEFHKFDLTQGDLSDFWQGFETKDGRNWDVNFHQEDETCEPNASVFEAKMEDGHWEIDTSVEYSLECIGTTGNAKDYFEVLPPIHYKVEEQLSLKLVKQNLDLILQKINDCGVGAWDGDLETSREAVALEDFYGDPDSKEPTTRYNGWFEDLQKLKKILG